MNLTTTLQKIAREKITVRENGRVRIMTKLEALVMQLMNRAMNNDLPATKLIHECSPAKNRRLTMTLSMPNLSPHHNDFSVCTTWGLYDSRYYLLYVFRKRLNYPELKQAVLDQLARRKPGTMLIEDKASGTQLIHELLAFPSSKHDDQVDSTTQTLDHLQLHSEFDVWARGAR